MPHHQTKNGALGGRVRDSNAFPHLARAGLGRHSGYYGRSSRRQVSHSITVALSYQLQYKACRLQHRYQHCTSIRLWKAFCEDEGVRAVCQYLDHGKNVAFLELLDNQITPLGCEFLSKALHPKSQPMIQILKLDHNNFGSAGVIALSEGLAVNPVLRMLSLTYCGIDAEGADALFDIMIYTRSAIEEINLSGNCLMNEGIITLLRGVSIAKSLKKLLIADNQFNDDQEVLKALYKCMKRNEKLGKYDLKFNSITDDGK